MIIISKGENIVTGQESVKEDPVKAVMELINKLGGDAIIDFVSPKNLVFRDLENFYRFSSCKR
jgi:hypothetical protein